MTNDAKVRLASEIDLKLLLDHNLPIKIQETDYYSDRCTNNIATKALMLRGDIIKSGSSLMMEETGKLAPLVI